MTSNELELLGIIRDHENPQQAILIAIDTISSFLGQLESSQAQTAVVHQERV